MEGSQRSRIEIIRYGWKMAEDYPWGAGYRGHQVLSPNYIPDSLLTMRSSPNEQPIRSRSAHNTFMAALVEQGYPGAILYIALQAWIFLSLFRLNSLGKGNSLPSLAVYRAALATAFIACFICGQFINILNAEVQIWLIALLAVLKNLYHESMPAEVQHRPPEYRVRQKASVSQSGSNTRLVPRRN